MALLFVRQTPEVSGRREQRERSVRWSAMVGDDSYDDHILEREDASIPFRISLAEASSFNIFADGPMDRITRGTLRFRASRGTSSTTTPRR